MNEAFLDPSKDALRKERREGELRIIRLIAADAALTDVLDAIISCIEAQTDGMLGTVLLIDDRGVIRHGAAPHLPAGFLKAFDGEEIGPDRGSCGTAAWRDEPVIVEDIATDPLWDRYRAPALAAGLRACWSVPIHDADDKVIGTFALYYREPRRPSPQLLALAEHASLLASIAISRQRSRDALLASEMQVAHIYDHVEDILFQLRVEGSAETSYQFRFESVNAAFLRTTGLVAPAIVGRLVQEVIPPPSLDLVIGRYLEAIRTKRTVRWDETTAYPAGTRHGEVAVTPVFDTTGRPSHLIGAVRDVTTRRAMEQELRHLQKMEAISRLSGGIAHDFNNLLSVILLSGTALSDELTEPTQRTLVGELLDAGRRGATLTRQFLAMSRKQRLEPEVIDLNAVLSDIDRLLGRLLPESIRLETMRAEGLWTVEVDRGQLEQVIMNLAVNARDAMPNGGTLRIETANVEVDRDMASQHLDLAPGSYVTLSVSDDGTGMDAAVQARIFEPFFTTKGPEHGTGLGLATVYGIIKQSGGEIWVYSEPGRGSTFRVYLRRSHAEPTRRKRRTSRSSGGRTAQLRALVVEDEPSLRTTFERLLPKAGCEVTVASTAEQALEMLGRDLPRQDLLITDLVLPGIDGIELARRLRAQDPELGIVIVSGYPERSVTTGDELPRGAKFLMKPFSLSAMVAVIDEIVAARAPSTIATN